MVGLEREASLAEQRFGSCFVHRSLSCTGSNQGEAGRRPGRVVAGWGLKVEWRQGELYPRFDFIVTAAESVIVF